MRKRIRRKKDILFDEVVSDSISGETYTYKETPIDSRMFYAVFAVFLFIATVLAGRAGYLSIIRHEHYAAKAQANNSHETPLLAPRGIILDRYGEALVENSPIFSVSINVKEVLKNGDIDATLTRLEKILMFDKEVVNEQVAAFDLENDEIIVVARDITRDQVLAVKDAALPGVFVEDDYKRYYPYREVAHVLGYVGQSSENARIHGRTGIEAAYNERLDGIDGKKILHTNAVGEEQGFAVVEKSVIGDDIHTTIDLAFQKYFYERFSEGLATLGRTAGLGLAMDPQTGEVLAMMSFPDYDPNAIADYFTEPEQPLFNRAISGTYNPASTIKIFHAAAALHEGVVTPTKQIYSAGYIELPNPYFPDNPSRFVDWKPHGWVDVRSALARSSNVYFYEVIGGFESQKGVGIERLRTYWSAFGFGKRTNIDIPGEATGFLPSPTEKEARTGNPWRVGDTYNISIGQGDLLLTPIQLVTGVSAVLNGGTVYEPYINQEKGPVASGDISYMENVFREVREGMRDGASETYGTSYLLHDLPVEVLAKTGSAQVSNKTKTNALFVGAIPADEPELVILILIEDAKVGSINTLPTAKDVLRWYYQNRIATPKVNDSEAN